MLARHGIGGNSHIHPAWIGAFLEVLTPRGGEDKAAREPTRIKEKKKLKDTK